MRCPVCRHLLEPGRLFCRRHWLGLPFPLRERLHRLAKDKPGGYDYRQAMLEAVRILVR